MDNYDLFYVNKQQSYLCILLKIAQVTRHTFQHAYNYHLALSKLTMKTS